MLEINNIAHKYSEFSRKPLFLIPDTSFLLRLLFALPKTKGSNDDLAMLKLLNGLSEHTPCITILSKSVIQEFLNLPVPCKMEDIFNFDGKTAHSIKLDTERFSTRFKYYDSNDHKAPIETVIRYPKFIKRLNWLKEFINSDMVMTVDTELDRLYMADVQRTLSTHDRKYSDYSNDDFTNVFLDKSHQALGDNLIKKLIKNKVRKDIGEISSAFSILEIQKQIGFETPARFIFAYNGNDDRGWLLETYTKYAPFYKAGNFEEMPTLQEYKQGRLVPDDIYNPNTLRFDKQSIRAAIGQNIDIGFMTTSGFFRIMGQEMAALNNEKSNYYLFEPKENNGNKTINIETFSQNIEQATNIAERTLGSAFYKIYKKYKDIKLDDITPNKNNEISFKNNKAGPFETFCKKNQEGLEKVAESHNRNMKEYFRTRSTIYQTKAIEMLNRAQEETPEKLAIYQ